MSGKKAEELAASESMTAGDARAASEAARAADAPDPVVAAPLDTDADPDGTSRRIPVLTMKHRLVLADVSMLLIGFGSAFAFQAVAKPVPIAVMQAHARLALVSLPFWLVGLYANKLFTARAIARPTEEARRILGAVGIGVGSMISVAFLVQYAELSRLWMGTVFIACVVLLMAERRVARGIFARLRREGRLSRRVVIVGTDAHAIGMLHTFQRRPDLGYEVVGFVGDDDLGERGGVTVLGTTDEVERVLEATDSTGVMVSLSSVSPQVVNSITRRITDAGFHVALSSCLQDIDVKRFRPQEMGGQAMLYVEPTIRTGWRAAAKRVFDVSMAIVALVTAAPVIAIAAIAIKLESKGPVFFRQVRVGRNGEQFRIVKLRTMGVDAEARKAELLAHNESDGPLFKMSADPRITRVGGFLRKTSIDEIPQFWNVLRGEMSVVGPRPALPSEVEQWTADVHDRLRVLPGITGMWQVSGRSDTSFDEYKRLDLYYVDNWSLAHDVSIVAKTFGAIAFSRGAK